MGDAMSNYIEVGRNLIRMYAQIQTDVSESRIIEHMQSLLNKAQTLRIERDQLRAELAEKNETIEYLNALDAQSKIINDDLQNRLTAAREQIGRLTQALNDCLRCVSAARIEGLDDALANTPDERLRDLVERRLLWVEQYAAIEQAGGGV